MIYLNEVFPAVQGEGPLAGSRCVFVRLHGCPVGCAYCDTRYTWDGSERGERVAVEEVVRRARVAQVDLRHVVVSGGEPLVQLELPALLTALGDLVGSSGVVEVETSGIRPPPRGFRGEELVRWNVSPKLPSAEAKIPPSLPALRAFLELGDRATLKLVVSDEADLAAGKRLVGAVGWPWSRVLWMPEGATRERHLERLAWLMELAAREPFPGRITPRLHVAAFSARRGV